MLLLLSPLRRGQIPSFELNLILFTEEDLFLLGWNSPSGSGVEDFPKLPLFFHFIVIISP